jgi:hypothetical protein
VSNILEPYAGAVISRQAQVQARKPEIKQVQEQPTENPPFKSSYEKFLKPASVENSIRAIASACSCRL